MWLCPNCGCAGTHYNPRRMAMVCDQCGTPVANEAEDRLRMNDDRTLAQARAHLQVGNWDECTRLLTPLLNRRPTEKQLYLMLLACCTCGYTDLLLTTGGQQAAAARYWDKLLALRCINGPMQAYALRRRQALAAKRRAQQIKILLLSLLALALPLLALALEAGVLFLAAAILGVLLFRQVFRLKPIDSFRSLPVYDRNRNPFD